MGKEFEIYVHMEMKTDSIFLQSVSRVLSEDESSFQVKFTTIRPSYANLNYFINLNNIDNYFRLFCKYMTEALTSQANLSNVPTSISQ